MKRVKTNQIFDNHKVFPAVYVNHFNKTKGNDRS